MSAQLVSLEAKAMELEVMISYVRAKIDWLKAGQQGPEPDFGSYTRGSRITVDKTGKSLPEDGRNGSCSVSSNSVK